MSSAWKYAEFLMGNGAPQEAVRVARSAADVAAKAKDDVSEGNLLWVAVTASKVSGQKPAPDLVAQFLSVADRHGGSYLTDRAQDLRAGRQ